MVAPPLAVGSGSSSTTSKNVASKSIVAVGPGAGSGSGSGTTVAAQNASVTTPPISFGVAYSTVVTLAESFALLRLSVSSPARVQLYSTQNSLAMDSGRDLLTPVLNGPSNGVIADFDLELAAEQNFLCSPAVLGFNGDTQQSTAIYIAVTNMKPSTVPITVSFFFIPLQ